MTSKKRLSDLYIERAHLFGFLWCVIPAAIVWTIMLAAFMPFRTVYLLRFAAIVLVGGPIGAFANRYGVDLWLAKNGSPKGPATAFDGMAIGMAVGWTTGLVGPLANFIMTEHVEQVKAAIIVGWAGAAVVGAIVGGLLARVWHHEYGSK